jgi:hypothetical protein
MNRGLNLIVELQYQSVSKIGMSSAGFVLTVYELVAVLLTRLRELVV